MEAPLPIAPTSVGNYTLGPLLGRGGMSEVYACSHPSHGEVALKLLRDDADGAFQVEARTRDVHHANVVRVLDAGLDAATHRYFLVMERLDGPDLATHLSTPLDERSARVLFAQIADGMHAVHAHNIVHRDLKPANVMLHAGSPRIVDFGIAKILGENAALVTSRRIGTLGYMAPEQLVGGRISPSVDVWALGIMLFEAVTCRLPFDGFTESYSPQLVESAPRVRSIASVSPAYDALVAACLDPDPAKRPPMVYVARALRGEVAVASETDERVTQDIGAMPPALASSRSSPMSASSVSPSGASPMSSSASRSSQMSPASSSSSPPARRTKPLPWAIGAVLAVAAIVIGVFVTRTTNEATDERGSSSSTPATNAGSDTAHSSDTPAPDTGHSPDRPGSDTAHSSDTADTAHSSNTPTSDTTRSSDIAASKPTLSKPRATSSKPARATKRKPARSSRRETLD